MTTTTTPQPQVDIEELEAKIDSAGGAHDCLHVGVPSTTLAALITETRALRAVKLRVHAVAVVATGVPVAAGLLERDMREIERITR